MHGHAADDEGDAGDLRWVGDLSQAAKTAAALAMRS